MCEVSHCSLWLSLEGGIKMMTRVQLEEHNLSKLVWRLPRQAAAL